MKKKYETPWLQIERFNLDDPDIVASNWSGVTGGDMGGATRPRMLSDGLEF